MPMATQITAAPLAWPQALADLAAAIAEAKGVAAPAPGTVTPEGQHVAASLLMGERKAVLLGNAAAQHPQASTLLALAQWIAAQTEASCGYLCDAGNSVGAQLVSAVPGPGGLNAGQMLSQPMKALLLLNTEPVLDSADAAATRKALSLSGLVVGLTAFKDTLADVADVLLPIAPFTETSGTFVNAEGRVQGFHGVVKPMGDARPGWKVLRVLGNLLDLPGFEYETSEDVRAEALGDVQALATRLDNGSAAPMTAPAASAGLQRVSDVPIYASDATVRRAHSLQLTADARGPVATLPAALWQQLGLQADARVRVSQGDASVVLPARLDTSLAENTVRVAAGHLGTAMLGAMFGAIAVEKA
jgi:NADH-quinone oxidoreductase subunit G